MAEHIRILIAEDNADLRGALCALVDEEPGMQCVGETAELEEIVERSIGARAEVVVLDIELQGKSSLPRLGDLRARLPQVKFVIFSGHNNPALISGAKAAGAAGYVVKSGDIAELIGTIRRVMEAERPLGAA